MNKRLEIEKYKIFLKLSTSLIGLYMRERKRQGWKGVFNAQLRTEKTVSVNKWFLRH